MSELLTEHELTIRNLLAQRHSEDEIVAYFFWGEPEEKLRKLIREVKGKVMTHTSSKKEELDSEITGLLFDLTDFSIYKFETQEDTDEAYATVFEYKKDATDAIKELVVEQVTQALKELKEEVIGEDDTMIPGRHRTTSIEAMENDIRLERSKLRAKQRQVIDQKIKALEGDRE